MTGYERWKNRLKHGYGIRAHPHPLYGRWMAMLSRCYNPNSISYRFYGAKDVTVCERWRKSFPSFLADVGEPPGPGYTLDRIDPNGNYEPSNFKWATWTEQGRSRRFHKLSLEKARAIRALSAKGMPCREIADLFDISKSMVREVVHNRQWKES